MCRGVLSVVVAVVMLMMTACGGEVRNIEVHDTEAKVWAAAEEFVYNNSDTLSRRNIAIMVRYDGDYVAKEVPMRILTISPDSMVLEEKFTLRIPQLADMRPEEHMFKYRSNVLLRRKGEYRFRLTPDEPVMGIASVGIIVD